MVKDKGFFYLSVGPGVLCPKEGDLVLHTFSVLLLWSEEISVKYSVNRDKG